MHVLRQEGNGYFIEYAQNFQSEHTFKDQTIDKVFHFAYAMAFGEGEHRDHRTGGTINRKKGQIFINTFQGKLSELGVYNTFAQLNKEAYQQLSPPDFNIYGLGKWDESDIELNKIKFSIKSTKYYGNLLLLETKDWSQNGEYLPNLSTDKNSIYDYFVLVRMKPDGEKMMSEHRLLYSNDIDKDELYALVKSQTWEYDLPGYITHKDLKYLISNDFILPKGSLLNGKTPMDAENYYIQTREMRDFKDLVQSILY